MSRPVPDPDALARLERRAERERRARHEAERLLEQKSLELYSANRLLDEASAPKGGEAEQLDLFTDYAAKKQQEQADEAAHVRERKIQEAMLGIKKKFGKNAVLKGTNYLDGATMRERNQQIGGHKAK